MLPVLHSASLAPFAGIPFGRLESFLDRFVKDLGEPVAGPSHVWSHTPVSIWADENHLHIEADMPGLTEKDVEVTVHNDVLSIKAVRQEPTGRKYIFNGQTFGRFDRSIALPEAVDTDHIEAAVVNGVLSLALPKKADARPKKISIKGGA